MNDPDETTASSDRHGSPDPITLRDLLILIVAAAIALGYGRAFYSRGAEISSRIPAAVKPFGLIPNYAVALLIAFLLPIGLALGLARLLRPRSNRDSLTTEPGFVAVAATSVVWVSSLIVDSAALVASRLAGMGTPGLSLDWLGHILGLSNRPAGAVLAVWALLVLGGRWRPRKTWLDRTGRLYGVISIILFVALQWTLASA